MDINFQRKVDRYIGAFVCRILSLFSRKKNPVPSPDKPNKILVLLLSEMGSLVLAYPMFQRIKEKYPESTLYGLLFEKNKEAKSVVK